MIAVACKKDEPTPSTTTPPITTTPGVKSTAKDITKFSFATLSPVVDATIDVSTKAITATVPATTDITKLVPTITISDKSTVSPASGVAQDFSKEVSYTVTAEDGGTVVWKVSVTKVAVATKFLWDYTKIPTLERPNPTSLLIKGITIKSAPKLGTDRTYWISYIHPTKGTIYVSSLKEASDYSFDIEVKDLIPNYNYTISFEIAAYNCDASKDGPTCDKNTFIRAVPENNNFKQNTITAKTSDFPDNSDNTINSYKNVRIYVSKDTPNLEDSCLIDLKNGKVFPLKDGAKNAANIDVYLTYTGISLEFYSPEISYSSDNKLYPIIKSQKWNIYKNTTFSFGSSLKEDIDYTSLANWYKINNTSDINKFKFGYEKGNLYFGRTRTDGTLYESPSDNLLIGFRTNDGKIAVARLKESIGTSKGHLLIMDIKVQK